MFSSTSVSFQALLPSALRKLSVSRCLCRSGQPPRQTNPCQPKRRCWGRHKQLPRSFLSSSFPLWGTQRKIAIVAGIKADGSTKTKSINYYYYFCKKHIASSRIQSCPSSCKRLSTESRAGGSWQERAEGSGCSSETLGHHHLFTLGPQTICRNRCALDLNSKWESSRIPTVRNQSLGGIVLLLSLARFRGHRQHSFRCAALVL